MARNHPLRRYHELAAHYMERARRTRDPVLRQALLAAASLFQEKASGREHRVATHTEPSGIAPAAGEEALVATQMNHPLRRYRRRTAQYWQRALATSDPVLQGLLWALAGLYQELAARRENHLAREKTTAEAPGAARERRSQAMLARTPFLRRRGKGSS